jgi:hypothetical protein
MWYLLKVDALIGAFVFSVAGLLILAIFTWEEAKALVAARHRIYRLLTTPLTEPQVFAISRSFSRVGGRTHAASHKVQ